jgi:hypothetical protein
MPESSTLEVKRPLDMEDPLARFELAKDIAAIANAPAGGVIVVGAETKNVSGVDVIKRITPLRDAHVDARKLRSIVSSKIYPPLVGLDIRAIRAAASDAGGFVLMIDIPAQPQELKPILVHGASIDGKVRSIFVSIPSRDHDGTALLTLAALHSRLVAGSAWIASQSGSSDSK